MGGVLPFLIGLWLGVLGGLLIAALMLASHNGGDDDGKGG